MLETIKLRVFPNETQQALLQETFESSRFVYNYYLSECIKRARKVPFEKLRYNWCASDLTKLKRVLPRLKIVDSSALQNVIREQELMFQKVFDSRIGLPEFRTEHDEKYYRSSNTSTNSIRIENGHVRLPKVGMIRTNSDATPSSRVLFATVNHTQSGKYFVSLHFDPEKQQL